MEDHKSTGGQVRLWIHLRLQFVASLLRFQWPKPVMWPSLVSMGQKKVLHLCWPELLKSHKGEYKIGNIIIERQWEIRNNKSTYHREARGMKRGYQMMPEAARHHSPAHLCQPRCHVTHVLKRRPTSADHLLELQQSAESRHLLRTAHAISRQQLRMHRNQIPSERSKSILNRHSCSLAGCQKGEGRDMMGNV